MEAYTDEVEAIIEIEGAENEANKDTSGMSPLKKRSKGKKRSSSHPCVTLPEPKSDTVNTNTTKSASFLDDVVYSNPWVIIKLAIMLKSNKAFEEFK